MEHTIVPLEAFPGQSKRLGSKIESSHILLRSVRKISQPLEETYVDLVLDLIVDYSIIFLL